MSIHRPAAFVIISALVVMALVKPANADERLLEKQLQLSMSLDHNTGKRLGRSATAIKGYIKGGYVSRKPDARWDYTDYRVFRRPATFFGQYIVVVEEEYFDTYIGCCVSPGLGLILERNSDITSLQNFISSNECSLDYPANVDGDLKELGIAPSGRTFISVSCRERDANQ